MAATANPVGGSFSKQVSPAPYPSAQHGSNGNYVSSPSEHTGGDGQNVLSRLHALFRVDTKEGEGGRRMSIGERLDRAKTGPAGLELPAAAAPEVKEREAIKVFVVTWNMGDALPKGDLTVLLGEVPTYEPPPDTDKDKLPELPVEHRHPYHIVVVAGQECPTPSGVPRGLGGVMKGMSVRVGGHHKRKDKMEKKDSVDREESDSSSDAEEIDDDPTPRNQSPMPPSTPVPGQQQQQQQQHKDKTPAAKGWSTMLDDWFCGPPLKPSVVAHSPTVPNSPSIPGQGPESAPPIARSNSAPEMSAVESPTTPSIPIPKRPAATPSLHDGSMKSDFLVPGLGASYMSRQSSSGSSSPASSLADDEPGGLIPPPALKKKISNGTLQLPTNPKPDRPGLVIPVTEPARTGLGTGSYVHILKERLMGMYLTVYVYKGCEHLVQGVDKDFVTAGLAGGRLGNKGAIGISLKLADHRFLFVNSHLAAHTKRVSARLANLTKIKSELQLDTFLPKDDPRNQEGDIADRFDSVFWCGDLNFRLDMSRLHAQWLVDQKNYHELLLWDQLKGVMKDPDNNPFPGFQEGPIDFPPTFKYDVWKSVKATNRDIRRSMRRNGTMTDGKRETGAKELAKDLVKTLSPIATEEGEDEDGDGHINDRDGGTHAHDAESEYHTDRRSFESSVRSAIETTDHEGEDRHDDDDDDDRRSEKHIDASAYGSRHKALEVAIKSKTKKWLSYVKMDTVLAKRKSVRKRDRTTSGTSTNGHGNGSVYGKEFDQASRRTSMSSFVSTQTRLSVPARSDDQHHPNVASAPADALATWPTPQHYDLSARRPSTASSFLTASSPPQRMPPARRMSLLKRTVSGRSLGVADYEEPDMETDNREGVYDTSKKQRVPSWCDRVLWKAHVTPDPAEFTDDDIEVPREKRGSRFSTVMSNIGGHLRSSITRTSSMDHVNRSLPPTPPAQGTGTGTPLVESPTASPTLHSRTLSPAGSPRTKSRALSLSLSRKSRSTAMSEDVFREAGGFGGNGNVDGLPPKGATDSLPSPVSPLSGPGARHPLLHQNSIPPAPAKPTITFDLASPAIDQADAGERHHDASDRPVRSHSLKFRPRANSDNVKPPFRQYNSADQTPTAAAPGGNVTRKTSLSSPRKPRTSNPDLALHQVKTEHGGDEQQQRGAFMKFIRDLPNIIHGHGRHSVTGNDSDQQARTATAPPPLPPRRKKGEVVCLHYGTIDDHGMRQLEGRSDHRPAIFSAAVYI